MFVDDFRWMAKPLPKVNTLTDVFVCKEILSMKLALSMLLAVMVSGLSQGICRAQVAKFPGEMCDFAFDEHAGQLLSISHQAGAVYRFKLDTKPNSRDLRPAKQTKLTKPYRIALKRFGNQKRLAVIGGEKYDTLTILDATTLETIKTFTFPQLSLYGVMGSLNPDDPFVYYTALSNDSRLPIPIGPKHTFAIDLRSLKDLGRVFKEHFLSISESGAAIFSVQGKGIDFKNARPTLAGNKYREPPYDPFRSYVDEDGKIRADPTKAQSKSSDVSISHFHDYPVFARASMLPGKRPYNFEVHNINRSRLIESRKLPESMRGKLDPFEGGRLNRRRAAFQVFADDKNKRVIYCVGDSLVVYWLKKFKKLKFDELSPPFEFVVSPQRLPIGQKTQIKVANVRDGVRVRFGKVPSCFEKKGGGLLVRPTASNVGKLLVSFKVSDGKHPYEGKLEFEAVQSRKSGPPGNNPTGSSSPFAISDFLYIPKDKAVICWSGSTWNERGTLNETDIKSQLSKIDLKTGNSLPAQDLGFPVGQAALAGDRFVVMSYSGDQLRVYDQAGLKLLASKDLPESARPKRFEIVGNQIFVHRRNGDLAILKLDDLNLVEQRKPTTTRNEGNFFGIYMDGYLLRDQRSQQLKMLIPDITVPSAFEREGVFSGDLSGQRVPFGPIRHGNEPIKGSFPQLVTKYNRETGKITLLAEFPDWGKLACTIPICEVKDASRLPSVRLYDDLLIAGHGENMVVLNVTEFMPAGKRYQATSQEFSFLPEQSEFVINDVKTELTHKMIGGSAPIRFFETSFSAGVNVDPQTGNVTIDPDAIRNRHPSEKAQQLPLDWQKLSTELNQRIGEEFIQVPIQVSAIDGDKKVAQIGYLVLVSPNKNNPSKDVARDRQRAKIIVNELDYLMRESRGLEETPGNKALVDRLNELQSKFDRWKNGAGKKYFTERQGG